MDLCDFMAHNGPPPKTCPELQEYLQHLMRILPYMDQVRYGSDDHDPSSDELNALWSPCDPPPPSLVTWHNTDDGSYTQWFMINDTWYDFGGVTEAYYQKLLGYGPIAFWRLNETSGTDALDSTANGYDGTYSNVTLNADTGPDGEPCPTFNGTSSQMDASSSGVLTTFDTAEGSFIGWLQVSALGIWSNSQNHIVADINYNSVNRMRLRKNTSNQFEWTYAAGGTTETVTKASITDIGWVHVGLTWSVSNDRVRAFWNGVQQGVDQTGLGTWASAPIVTYAGSSGSGAYWSGSLAGVAVFDYELTPANMLDLATP